MITDQSNIQYLTGSTLQSIGQVPERIDYFGKAGQGKGYQNLVKGLSLTEVVNLTIKIMRPGGQV